MKQICLASFLTCVTTLAGCGGSASSPMPTVPTPAPAPGGPSASTPVGIVMGASFLSTIAYVPNPITVSMGTAIKWTNNDLVAHTVSSQNNLWDSGDLEPGATYSRTFPSSGTFLYYCAYHPLMVGTITVQ
jgi:plastocyanin